MTVFRSVVPLVPEPLVPLHEKPLATIRYIADAQSNKPALVSILEKWKKMLFIISPAVRIYLSPGKREGARHFLLVRLRLRRALLTSNTISPACCVRLAPLVLPRDRTNCQLRDNGVYIDG